MKKVLSSVRQFCLIQLQVLKDREQKLRKELLDCKIQSEYLTSVLQEVAAGKGEGPFDKATAFDSEDGEEFIGGYDDLCRLLKKESATPD